MSKKNSFLAKNKALIIISSVFTVIILVLCGIIYSLQRQIDGAFDSIKSA